MIDPNAFAKMVPGFDFLQSLMGSAGQMAPAMGRWVAPTLDPDELDKRIDELKTVQFWLEQNSRMIGATVQALEVQRMTLSTLRTMNLPMGDLHKAMTLPEVPARAAERSAAAAPAAPRQHEAAADAPQPAPAAAEPPKPAGVDPMQWWGALTQQFGELAAKAVQEGQALAAHTLAAAKTAAEPEAKPAEKPKAKAKPAAAPHKPHKPPASEPAKGE